MRVHVMDPAQESLQEISPGSPRATPPLHRLAKTKPCGPFYFLLGDPGCESTKTTISKRRLVFAGFVTPMEKGKVAEASTD